MHHIIAFFTIQYDAILCMCSNKFIPVPLFFPEAQMFVSDFSGLRDFFHNPPPLRRLSSHFFPAFQPSFTSGYIRYPIIGLGGLGVIFSPRDPRFAHSNPTGVDGFFQDVKILSTSPLGGTLTWGFRV